nr:hypothetical protein pmam_458 [Pithovirus mammoth]
MRWKTCNRIAIFSLEFSRNSLTKLQFSHLNLVEIL